MSNMVDEAGLLGTDDLVEWVSFRQNEAEWDQDQGGQWTRGH